MGFLFGEPKIQGEERQKCLAYLQEEFIIAAFDQKGREVLENTMAESAAKLNTYQITSQQLQKEISKATHRLALTAKETVRRGDDITSVPSIALSTYSAWRLTYSAYSAWATEQADQEARSAEALIPSIPKDEVERTIKLLQEYEKRKEQAAKEHYQLIKRLKLSDAETQELLNNAATSIAEENWQPQKSKKT